MTHFPLAQWADCNSLRWTAVSSVLIGSILFAYYITGKYDEAQDIEDARIEAERDGMRQLKEQKALQEKCGGPNATVRERTLGGYDCLNKHGRKTKTIPS